MATRGQAGCTRHAARGADDRLGSICSATRFRGAAAQAIMDRAVYSDGGVDVEVAASAA